MQIPNARSAYVPPDKVSEYLLSNTHPVGKTKRALLELLGYGPDDPGRLAADLLRLVQDNPVEAMIRTPYGTKWIVSGFLRGPAGLGASMRTVWLIEEGTTTPRFITAYPTRRWNH